ncbi:hypothetical protein ILUMI_22541 [Ignelater luminosus]|uniref:Reverse transcriptase domain-containing protein n=1 Tax=Ignelater luminosus TaxID=2038154 RepID=A0A8K0G2T4_IGNLU|nr:hypothetical protein ILUMI_22541 [Ignelater luminosus]
MDKNTGRKVKGYNLHNERIILVKIETVPKDTCQEIEEHIIRGKHDLAYKIVENFSKEPRKRQVLESKTGQLMLEQKEYLEVLYNDEEGKLDILKETRQEDERDDTITRSEYERAVADLKNYKTPEVNQIPAEIIKQIRETNYEVLQALINKMYKIGKVPEDLNNNLIIPIKLARKQQTGIKIQGTKITMLRYADDMVMLTESEEELNQAMREIDIQYENE